jgi:hypothetical protein
MKGMIPTMPEIVREAVIVAAGALLAAVVIKALPAEIREHFTFGNKEI